MRSSDLQGSDRTGAVRGAWLPALLLIIPGVVAGLYWRTTSKRTAAPDRGAETHSTAWSRTRGDTADAGARTNSLSAPEFGGDREPVSAGSRLRFRDPTPEESHPDPLAVFEEGSPASLEAGDAEWLAGYRALAGLGGLDEVALRDMRSPASTARKAALLRVLYETDAESTEEAFRLALAESDDASPRARGTVGLARFTMHHLDQRALREPRARALMDEYLRASSGDTRVAEQVALRSRAANTLGRATPASDFESLAATLAGQADPAVLRAAFAGLSQNPDAIREPGPFLALGFDPPARIEPESTEP
jgi:hypothetical protein